MRKPHLKLLCSGELVVLKTGINPWNQDSARTFVREQYGSLAAFSKRFNLPYGAVCVALRSINADEMAGSVAAVRQVLGLTSSPTKMAVIAAHALQRRKGAV
ncbi:hypothetical protein [Acidovorax sp. BLS4]|uniref:hypothetical protein n=1 Tax=Acidovorax sp. BLS4 TaxID=3273430 RepID=UPI0029422D1F|nr:hypothetical protein [Paracidovorax avenae]WOI45869.1 hypothetical protein R1Z03_01240 [Paracidovorax avenae]